MHQGEFWEAMFAYRMERNAERRHIGELVRGATARILNLHLKTPIKRVEEFWPMPWDLPSEEDEELNRLNNLTDEERTAEAENFLAKIGW